MAPAGNKSLRLSQASHVKYDTYLPMGAIGTIVVNGHKAFMNMLNNLSTSKQEQLYLEKKIITICIRCTYYIFCKRDSEWTSPELFAF